MSGFLLRIMINGIMLFLVIVKFPGIFVDTLGSTLVGVTIIGFANAAIRPLLAIAELPFTWQTLGSFTLFTNVLTPMMVVKTLPGYQIHSIIATLGGLLLITVCSCTLSKVIKDR
ncbi:phage holin family protein|uniref:Putative membrane protein n=1 Tax=Dendrosporobacter quercicolus TaxID=146817 RepID=A0A1G9YWS0_9FIRM|nr:phage holin family protein [Dendrosporobacter quercicolus]NSL49278.1 phage holin family protein [Dendrosporobacter quercicolus DSM 1736]SDN13544.1 putative membrane protein [Dendrosporobacter quercicolus]